MTNKYKAVSLIYYRKRGSYLTRNFFLFKNIDHGCRYKFSVRNNIEILQTAFFAYCYKKKSERQHPVARKKKKIEVI